MILDATIGAEHLDGDGKESLDVGEVGLDVDGRFGIEE